MAQPAKRRRRNIVETSDDEDCRQKPEFNTLTKFLMPSSSKSKPTNSPTPTSTSPLKTHSAWPPKAAAAAAFTTRLPTRGDRRQDGVVLASSSPNSSSEKKNRATKRTKTEEKGRTADLMALFSNQAQRAKVTPVDNISDPISEDDGFYQASSSSIVGQTARKRLRDNKNIPTTIPSSTQFSAAPASQRFLRPSRPSTESSDPTPPAEDLRPWSERFGPVNLDELAVHKRKVLDVRRWLEEVLRGRMRQRLLVLKGAAGTGKTTTVRLLARDLGCELVEWKNPVGALGRFPDGVSMGARFQDFLGVRNKFGVLDTDVDDEAEAAEATLAQPPGHGTRKIFLIEEFPNTFTRSSSALSSFRRTILDILASCTPRFGQQQQASVEHVNPIIMVVSESLLTTASASADSLTAHRLLGPEILRHAGAGVIEFNAIAPSLLAKALELVVQKEARKSGRRHTPGPLVLKRLGEIGDIRNAVATLEFLCVKGDGEADWGSKVSFTKRKRGPSKKDVSMTKDEKQSLELMSQREASLGIFHAVGKVVYNKREEEVRSGDSVEALPRHLRRQSRPKRSLVSVDSLMDETGTDTHTFISALYENYVLSCESVGVPDRDPSFSPSSFPSPSSSLDHIIGCIDYLSESDLLYPTWDIFFGGKGALGGLGGKDSASHLLRQDEMAFQLAVRGLLFALPSPVKRKMAGTGFGSGKTGDNFKMFYPTNIKLWREKEELEELIDMWSTSLLRGDETAPQRTLTLTDGASAFRRPTANQKGGVAGWTSNNRRPPPNSAPSGEGDANGGSETSSGPLLLSLGSAARRELVLERLPYMAHVCRARKYSSSASASTSTLTLASSLRLRDLDRVVSFRGIGPPTEDESPDEADGREEADGGGGGDGGTHPSEAWATDRPEEGVSPRNKKRVGIRTKNDSSLLSGLATQKLVLSDDDIEDD